VEYAEINLYFAADNAVSGRELWKTRLKG